MFFFTDNTVIMVLPPKGKILKVKEWLKINNQMKEKIKKEERYWNSGKLLKTGMVS